MASTFAAVEIGGTKLQLVAGSGDACILDRRRLEVDPARGANGIREQIAQVWPELAARWRPAAIGVGFGGPVDWKSGRIARSHQIEGWSDFDLGSWLGDRSGLPVAVDNDANVAALGEALHGAGRGARVVFYVTLGSGVGGGCALDGRIYHGTAPGESEIGHLRLDRQGTIVEQRCSGWAVDRRIRELKQRGEKSLLCDWMPEAPGGEAKLLARALAAGDAAAGRLLDEVAGDLAFALSHVTHLMHPEVIVLGGGLSLLGEPLRAAVAHALPSLVMEAFHGGPTVRLSALAEDAVPVGALALAASTPLSAP